MTGFMGRLALNVCPPVERKRVAAKIPGHGGFRDAGMNNGARICRRSGDHGAARWMGRDEDMDVDRR